VHYPSVTLQIPHKTLVKTLEAPQLTQQLDNKGKNKFFQVA
jgi:hypothetical protein